MVNKQTGWDFADDEERRRMLEEPITVENCGEKLALVLKVAEMSRRALASALGVSEATLRRLEKGPEPPGSKPTEDFMNRLRALCLIGKAKFEGMSEAEKEKVSETIGAAGGATLGIGGALGAVSALGAVGGLSAAGMTSGLAALGMGSMFAGIGVVAAIPVATGALGYGLVKGIKAICTANKLESEEVDGRWEIRTRPDVAAMLPSDISETVRTILSSQLPQDDLFVWPEIPAKKLEAAGHSCALPKEEHFLGLIDCTVFGSCKNCVVFGEEGIYYCNGWNSRQQGRGKILYSEFPKRTFAKNGMELNLDCGQFVDLSGSNVSTKKLIEILDAISRHVKEIGGPRR